jgi:hypothetical protein
LHIHATKGFFSAIQKIDRKLFGLEDIRHTCNAIPVRVSEVEPGNVDLYWVVEDSKVKIN